MQFLNWDDVHSLAHYPTLVDAIASIYSSGCSEVGRIMLSQPTVDGDVGDFLLQPAWLRGRAFGVKIANVFPENAKRGHPSILGVYILFDGNTGEMIGCIDGPAETAIKTASNSAVASRLLSREDASTMLMMGAGNLAPYLIAAHSSIRPIRRVMIWNRSMDKAKALAAKLDRPDFKVEAVADAAEAAGQADIISCATYSTTPILKGEWINAGTHVDLVGSYTPEFREADDDVLRKAGRLFVDERTSTVGVSGDVIHPVENGVISLDNITDLFELAQGRKPGRQSAKEVTVFKSGGGGHEDLATALYLFDRAKALTASPAS